MNASTPGSKDWWTVVHSMPLIERLDELEKYRAALIAENTYKSSQLSAQVTINKVNHEIKRTNRIITESSWQKACKQVLDQETFHEVYRVKRILEEEVRA